jgi:hypothetical protein
MTSNRVGCVSGSTNTLAMQGKKAFTHAYECQIMSHFGVRHYHHTMQIIFEDQIYFPSPLNTPPTANHEAPATGLRETKLCLGSFS